MPMEDTMRIAQLAPLVESVPPACYGGTERVVACLTDELVRRGHAVTLFASGDSETRADLVPVTPRGCAAAVCRARRHIISQRCRRRSRRQRTLT
jgi:hypothetical protein